MVARIPIDEARLRDLIEVQKLQHHKVAALLGTSPDTVTRRCKALGIQSQGTGPRRGDQHTGWKGGRKLVKGYVYLYRPDHPHATKQGYVSEHRLVMEQKLGRLLLPTEVVHHKDENTQNNAPDNLGLYASNAEHLQATRTGRVPQWTPEGVERIQTGLTKRANQLRSGIGVPQRNPQTGQWIATPDKPSPEA